MRGVVVGVLVCGVVAAQTGAQWRAKMQKAKKAADAAPSLRAALQIAESFGETDLRLFETVIRLAQECDEGCGDDSTDYLGRALKMRARVRPADVHYAGLLMDLGHVAKARDALLLYGEAVEIRERLLGKTDEKVAELYAAMAWVYQGQKDPKQARTTMRHALEIREQAHAEATDGYADLLTQSARLDQETSEFGAAETEFRRVVEIEKRLHPRREVHYDALKELANLLQWRKRPAEAEVIFLEAFGMRRRDPEAASCLLSVAECRRDRGLYAEALEAAETSRAIDDSVRPYPLLVEVNLRLHNEVKAEEYLKRLTERAARYEQGLTVQAAEKASAIYQERGNYPRAAEKLELAIATREAADPYDPQLPDRMLQLGRLYQAMGRLQDANRVNMAAVRLSMKTAARAAGGKNESAVWAGVFVILVVLPLFIGLISGLVYWRMAKRLDRRVAALFEVAQVAVAGGSTMQSVGREAYTARVAVCAEGTTLFAIRVLNLLLSLCTLGVYSFWGKAKVRRFVCGQAEFLGDRFAFHGTGRELLMGWLRALPALAFVILFPQVLPIFWPGKNAYWVAEACAVAAFLLLWPIARVGAYRYRLNRMSWRGIRFSHRGTGTRFLGASIAGGLLSILTLGIYAPFLQVRLRRMLFARTCFGDGEFQFAGRGQDLLPAWLFALPLTLGTFGIGWAWWSALRHRYYWAHTTFAGARFRCTATGGRVLGLWAGNAAIIVGTIGLGMSWAMLRTLRFWTRHIELVGDADLAVIRQDARAASASGESFADFLGFDFGF